MMMMFWDLDPRRVGSSGDASVSEEHGPNPQP
jgi:hypothetical protein